MNEDFRDVLAALLTSNARFLVVGAHAMAVHGVPRATGDLDLWVARDKENVRRVWQALSDFGAPLEDLQLRASDLEQADTVVQLGLPPRRIDILTGVSGLDFEEAWRGRLVVRVQGLDLPFLDRSSLLKNKRATGRLKDRADLEALGEDSGMPDELE